MLFASPACQSEKAYQEENKNLKNQAALFPAGNQMHRRRTVVDKKLWPSCRRSPLDSHSRTKCFAILAPFDILKEIAAVNFEWVEVVREGDAN
jgi:hypothetical protein